MIILKDPCRTSHESGSKDDLERIKEILPHRDPFLFLTRIISIEEGKSATAEYDVPRDHIFFKGHFPGEPILPGVIILEMMAQTGALAVLCDPSRKGKVVYLAGIESARLKKPVRPGDTLRAQVTIDGVKMSIGKGTGRAFVGEEEVASAKVIFGLPV
ncbi:MAG: 3-hydroxyacyl-ACP dehydratase FabZ [Firmicutes bacterium]|jgi:3-hydroxyacyl-[acyl-carrier-protein] dehydratase|nr:3-hydroxyacyl-ACP dehydratase FabZ [Candidatus Fermentithermobacillaceae bacterium]